MNDEVTFGATGSGPVFAAVRLPPKPSLEDNDLPPYDVFRGDTTDRLGDGGFADPRETKLIDVFNKALVVNRALGDPLGIGDDPFGRAPRTTDAGPTPPAGDTSSPAYLDP